MIGEVAPEIGPADLLLIGPSGTGAGGTGAGGTGAAGTGAGGTGTAGTGAAARLLVNLSGRAGPGPRR